ncbi:MAG TPA: cyclomaltodextrinase N-terminal domain-containing protein, partial [Cyclobacteriaceae bacterium]|nr:cyclomaltodextrinase N-terminal domain-containing protein [Cyclobacteriaceae bacterium]
MRINVAMLFVLLHVAGAVYAQKSRLTVDRVEPPSWWTGMVDERLQLLIKGENISSASVSIAYPGVEVVS